MQYRNPSFKKDGTDYHVATDITAQANYLGVTIQADKPVLHYDHGSYHTSVHFKCASIKSIQGKILTNLLLLF